MLRFMDKEYLRDRANAAKWMRDRTHMSTVWNWGVLTSEHNSQDPNCLNLPPARAQNIFFDLQAREVLRPVPSPNGTLLGYALDLGCPKLEEVINPPGPLRRAWLGLVDQSAAILAAVLTSVVTTLLTVYVTKLVFGTPG